MRLTALGTGVPRVMRSQYTTSYYLELGNGHKFLFDIGDGAFTNTIQVAPGSFGTAHLFLTHLHSDHIADAVQLLAMGPMMGGRKGAPLHVYGPSGPTAETGTAAFVGGLNRMLGWDRLARERVKRPPPASQGASCGEGQTCPEDSASVGEEGGANVAVAHEFDYGAERQLVYDSEGVKIYSTPVDHYFLGGPVAYRVEWRSMAIVFGGDSAPTPTLDALCRGADVLVLDAMATALDDDRSGVAPAPPSAAEGGGAALRTTTAQERMNIAMSHATPFEAGEMFAAAAPRLAIATHNAINTFSLPYIASEIRKAYGGALSVAQDLDFWVIGPQAIEAGRLMVPDQTWGLLFADNTCMDGGGGGGGGDSGGRAAQV